MEGKQEIAADLDLALHHEEDDDESEPSSDGETEATHDTVMLE